MEVLFIANLLIGQYVHVHLSSFTPWYRKTAWLRALIHRAYKLWSNSETLSIELSEISKFRLELFP